MATKLKNLVITKVALVDEGSCSAAHIKLYKRKEGGSNIMELEDLLKLIPENQREAAKACIEKVKQATADATKTKTEAEMEDMMDNGVNEAIDNPDKTPAKDTKKGALAKVAGKIKGLNTEISKVKNAGTASEEELLKNVDPAVRAILEKARTQAAAAEAIAKKMQDDAETSEALVKAKELPNLNVKADELAAVLKSLKNTDTKTFDTVYGILKSANEMIKAGENLGELGKSTSTETITKEADSAWADIESKAAEIQKAKSCTKEAAIATAVKENPQLYKKYLDTQK